jgi:hypothetical protein
MNRYLRNRVDKLFDRIPPPPEPDPWDDLLAVQLATDKVLCKGILHGVAMAELLRYSRRLGWKPGMPSLSEDVQAEVGDAAIAEASAIMIEYGPDVILDLVIRRNRIGGLRRERWQAQPDGGPPWTWRVDPADRVEADRLEAEFEAEVAALGVDLGIFDRYLEDEDDWPDDV